MILAWSVQHSRSQLRTVEPQRRVRARHLGVLRYLPVELLESVV